MDRIVKAKLHVSVVLREGDRVLWVQEAKPDCHGRWNLPGGHVEPGETLQQAAIREVREETNLRVRLTSLVGVYTASKGEVYFVRTVFEGEIESGEMAAGSDILSVQWRPISEVGSLADNELDGPGMLRNIITDLQRKGTYPLNALREL